MSRQQKRSNPLNESLSPGPFDDTEGKRLKLNDFEYFQFDSYFKQQQLYPTINPYMQVPPQYSQMPNPMFGYPQNGMGLGMYHPMTSYGGMFNQPMMLNNQMDTNQMYPHFMPQGPPFQPMAPLTGVPPPQGNVVQLEQTDSLNQSLASSFDHVPPTTEQKARDGENQRFMLLHGSLQCGIPECNKSYTKLNDLRNHVKQNNHYLFCHANECTQVKRGYIAKPYILRHGLQTHLSLNQSFTCPLPLTTVLHNNDGFKKCGLRVASYLPLVEHILKQHCSRTDTNKDPRNHSREYHCVTCVLIGNNNPVTVNDRMILANHVIDQHVVSKPNSFFKCFKCQKPDSSYFNTVLCCADKSQNQF